MSASGTADRHHAGPSGTPELREDVPLNKWGGETSRGACGGPRFIAGCFGALSVAVTVALLTQIYYGDFEVAAHGSVASSAAECSRAGTDALMAGGGAVDAAVTAALCLAVVAPHRTGLDASGSFMMWDYRTGRSNLSTVVQWGGAGQNAQDTRPRMLAALTWLHARYGRLPWGRVLQPAIDLASNGFHVSSELAISGRLVADQPFGELIEQQVLTLPQTAIFLGNLQKNTSNELVDAWMPNVTLNVSRQERLGRWNLQLPAAQRSADAAFKTLSLLFDDADDLTFKPSDDVIVKLAGSIRQLQTTGVWPTTEGVATGVAVIDTKDVYVSLVTGLSGWFGSKQLSGEGWLRDDLGSAPPPPAILVEHETCGQRYVIGAGDTAALVQVIGVLALSESDLSVAVEKSRVLPLPTGGLALESRSPPATPSLQVALAAQGVASNASEPYPSINVVQQRGDLLASHADSRGGGHASRF